jgi:hypothetical protein
VEEPAVSLLRQTACAVLKPIAFITILGFVSLWITAMAGAQMAALSQSGVQKQLSDLTTSLANGAVATIDILHMPDRIETPVSVTPESLEKWSYCRITITDVREWSGRDELIYAMRSSRLTADSRMPDLRSAVIFLQFHKTADRSVVLRPILPLRWRGWEHTGIFQGRFIKLAETYASIFVAVTGERRCRAALNRTGEGARPHMAIYD